MTTTPIAPRAPAAATQTASPAAVDAARRTGEEFEALFLSSIMENLFAGVASDGPFGGGKAEGMWRSVMLQEYGKVTAKAGGVGIADAVQREILRLQEAK
jgi:Rod binding domain-containing protein